MVASRTPVSRVVNGRGPGRYGPCVLHTRAEKWVAELFVADDRDTIDDLFLSTRLCQRRDLLGVNHPLLFAKRYKVRFFCVPDSSCFHTTRASLSPTKFEDSGSRSETVPTLKEEVAL